jgi:hypothetical protein
MNSSLVGSNIRWHWKQNMFRKEANYIDIFVKLKQISFTWKKISNVKKFCAIFFKKTLIS